MNKRMYRSPETEQKSASRLAYELHHQNIQRRRPFPETLLGRLPGEVREMIYEYVLVAPPS